VKAQEILKADKYVEKLTRTNHPENNKNVTEINKKFQNRNKNLTDSVKGGGNM